MTGVVVRWLLPLSAVLTLLSSSVVGYAAAGPTSDAACCCPDPQKCKCDDHDRSPKPSTMKRCGGEGGLATPLSSVSTVPILGSVEPALGLVSIETTLQLTAPDERYIEIETPPF